MKDFPASNRIFNNMFPHCGPSAYKPPHTNSVISCPIQGTALIRLVITVAPQRDIWPIGRTYPKNPITISNMKIIVPSAQTNVLGYL